MRRQTTPPAISCTIGARPSTSELTAFAPIASPVSTITWKIDHRLVARRADETDLDVARAVRRAGRGPASASRRASRMRSRAA